jgi:hypothetical protein
MKPRENAMWDKIKKHKFDYFLYSIVGMIMISPFFSAYTDKEAFPLAACFYALAVILILGMVVVNRNLFLVLAAFYLGVCVLNLSAHYFRPDWQEALGIFTDVMHCFALIVLFKKLLSFLFKIKQVSSEHVKAGIAIYFLMGILWGFLYRILFYFNPSSFIFSNPGSGNLFYFSYVTLASLGYGDITPASGIAQMLAVMEVTLAQIYIAVFISRLMGFRIAHELTAGEKEL